MARKDSSTIVQEELYPPRSAAARPRFHDLDKQDLNKQDLNGHDLEMDDARLIDLDVDEEPPFLRGQKRVSARRSSLPPKAANRLLWAAAAALLLGCAGLLLAGLHRYGERSWRFRVDSSDNIAVTGLENVSKAQIMEVMGADIGRNIFFVPLAQQKAQLEQIPWVQSASVMRFVPNQLKVEIQERIPAAFARVGLRILLIDAGGTLMELPRAHKYSFPVILGMNAGEPLSTRAPRMKAYGELVHDLDSGGARYSQDLSEVDLTDLDDVKVRVNDPAGDVLVHLGSSDYLDRYKIYVGHVKEWRQQFQKLQSVDLRYDNQIVVNPDVPPHVPASPVPARPALTAAAAKAARPGMQPAALTTPMAASHRAVPKPVFEMPPGKLNPKLNPKTADVNKSMGKPTAKSIAGRPKAANGTPKPAARKSAAEVHSAHGPQSPAASASQRSKHNPIQPLAASAAGRKPSPAIVKPQGSPN